jgi:hypothetical protein
VGPYQPNNNLSPGSTHKSNEGNVMILKTKREKTFLYKAQYIIRVA